MALSELHGQINPQPTKAEKQAKIDENFIYVTQRLYDQGDDMGARRVLANNGLGLT